MNTETENIEMADCYCLHGPSMENAGTYQPIPDFEPYNGKPNEDCHCVMTSGDQLETTDQKVYDDTEHKATTITLVPSSVELLVEESKTIVVSVTPLISNVPDICWESSDPEVAVVYYGGLVVGKKVGEATITATDACDLSVTATMTVKVVDKYTTATTNSSSTGADASASTGDSAGELNG